MKKTKLIIGFVLVFLLGALSGAVGLGYVYHKRISRFAEFDPPHRMEFITERLTKKLNLDKEQRAKVEKILAETQSALGDIRTKFAPEMQSMMDNAATRIKEGLTPEQRQVADRMFETMKRRMMAMHRDGKRMMRDMERGGGRGMMMDNK